MNARLYDAKLHRFLAPDSFIQDPGNPQNYNLYGYVYNNPLRFTDPSGNYAVVDDIVAAVIGGLVNLGVNIYQGNIHGSFWEIIGKGAAAFGSGAAAGTLSLYGPAGWAAGGALVGGTNAWLSGDNITQGAIMGGITGIVGGAVGSYISSGISVAIQGINISSPVLQGTLGGALGGGFTGGVMNSGIIGIQTGSFSQAIDGFGSGFAMGFVTGSISGASAAYSQARQNGISPWNGRSSTTPPSGSAMVDDAMVPVVKSLNAQIDKVRSEYVKLYRAVSNEELLDLPNGFRNAPNGQYETVKLFATTAQDAENFGKLNFTFDKKSFTIIETKLHKSLLPVMYKGEMDLMPVISIPSTHYQNLQKPVIHNNIKLPNHIWLK